MNNQDVLSQLYNNCYVYIHGHEYGGTNPTMIKAMASSCAILALETNFNNEMLQDGKFGLFFKKDANSLLNSINFCENEILLIEDLRSNSHKGVTKRYNWDFICEEYYSIFKKLIR